ncbi:MAG: ATP-binding protein [Gemmatimonadaceae bacterium]|nr:ATP-binding protein [Gemmatimonadaceae bacterium]
MAADPADPTVPRAKAKLPGWYPAWARQLAELYSSRTTSTFVLHGNTYDLVPLADVDAADRAPFGSVTDFLAEQMFGQWDVVLNYDLGRGLRVHAGRDEKRLKAMVSLATRRIGDLSTVKNDPTVVFALLDVIVRENIMAAPEKQLRLAVIVNHASYLFPAGEPGRQSFSAAGMAVSVLNWATSPHVRGLDMAFVLIDERRSDMSDRVSGNPFVSSIEVAMPDEASRLAFVRDLAARDDALKAKWESGSDYAPEQLATLTAGMNLNDIAVIINTALDGGQRLDAGFFRATKKRLIERQCNGLLEFVEPRWRLDTVIGHEAAKQRLRDDAVLLARGELDSIPMGYLLCGPVGTGKSFLAMCSAAEIGIPCVMLKNFRSKYVGETEGNLERVLSVLRAMGPVMVIIDEADAALGDRDTEGDSGTSSRVFGMIATQMGDTRYRGRIVWMLLTARPDLLPIDIKRQGRAEVHIPLFYPMTDHELRQMCVMLAKKLGTSLAPEDVPTMPAGGVLSGADIEGIIGRALRKSLLAGSKHITKAALAEVVDGFMPSTQGLEKELQETAAIIECTDREFLPAPMQDKLEKTGGRAGMQERLTALKQLVQARA